MSAWCRRQYNRMETKYRRMLVSDMLPCSRVCHGGSSGGRVGPVQAHGGISCLTHPVCLTMSFLPAAMLLTQMGLRHYSKLAAEVLPHALYALAAVVVTWLFPDTVHAASHELVGGTGGR